MAKLIARAASPAKRPAIAEISLIGALLVVAVLAGSHAANVLGLAF